MTTYCLFGRFPESHNVEEFAYNLYNAVEMVTEQERRWPNGLYGYPKRNGTLKDITRFDAQFFGINPKQVDNMDPQLRLLLEVAYEALFDSGFNPTELRGTRTGVFIGASSSEALHAFSTDPEELSGYSMTGCATSMLANRLSFFFDFKGPSYTIDTACSSSLVALDAAINDPGLVAYVEAHGTGTKADDPQELNSIVEISASPRLQRTIPFFIGSTKSNMGHPEPASGIAALVKMLISIQRGVIPGNLHYKEPNQDVPALLDGRIRVVNKNTQFRGGLMAFAVNGGSITFGSYGCSRLVFILFKIRGNFILF